MCRVNTAVILFAITILLAACASPVPAEDELDKSVQKINEAARRAKERGDYEEVEKNRRERWALIAKHAEHGGKSDSPWLAAYRAIEAVDGPEGGGSEAIAAGLLNELKYKEACDELWNAFTAFRDATDGPLMGELAVRFFEVAEQAKGLFYDALDPSSPSRVADTARIVDALTTARDRDPCCTLAIPMLHYLKGPAPEEAFLRAEVRPDFKQRQKELLAISHPMIGDNKDANKSEHADAAVMPWHAIVEIDKARGLQAILDDLEYTQPLTPDHVFSADVEISDDVTVKDVPHYVIPGAIFTGRDALGQPFQLVFGNMVFGRKADEKGRLRSVAFFLSQRPKMKNGRPLVKWDHNYLELVWRVPSEEEMDKDYKLKQLHDFLAKYPVRRKFTLGKQEFYVYEYPVRATSELINLGMQVLCVRSIDQLEKMPFSKFNNQPDALSKLMRDSDPLDDPFSNTPLVDAWVKAIAFTKDRSKHPLIELMRKPGLNPLVVVSEKNVKDKDRTGPALCAPEKPGESPFLKLDDGKKLYFCLDNENGAPCCRIEFPGATAYMPLMPHAIPPALLIGSQQGQACVSLLTDAGYSTDEAAAEMVKSMTKKPSYIPPKFDALLEARMRAKGLKGGNARLLKEHMFRLMLAEKGWTHSPSIRRALIEAYRDYGFRYLRDKRGNWVMARGLIEGVTQNKNLIDHPYAFYSQDGKRPVETSQIYSWPDYLQLKNNIFDEHLSKAMAFHPCLSMLEVIADDAETIPRHPDDSKPEYLTTEPTQTESAAAPSANANRTIHLLQQPIAPWMVNDDETQRTSLTHLLNAYTKLLIQYANSSREEARYAKILRLIDFFVLFAETKASQEQLENRASDYRQRYKQACEQDKDVKEAVLDIQLSAARDYAKRKYFHKSITFYNDALSQMHPTEDPVSRVLIFRDIPTSATGQKFIDDLDSMIKSQLRLLNIQAELAGVLNAAGLAQSAHYVWQRTIDDYEFFLQPSLVVAEGLLNSYGLRISTKAKEATQGLRDVVEECRAAVERYGGVPDWRIRLKTPPPPDAGGQAAKMMPRLRALLEQDNANELEDTQQREIEELHEKLTKRLELSFREWLDLKKLLIELRPGMARVPGRNSSILRGCPQKYTREDGFQQRLDEFMADTRAEEVEQWCAMPLAEANRGDSASRISFMLAWYFSDTGQVPLTRPAMVNLARVEISRARALGDTVEGLVHESNAFDALVAAGGDSELLPGLSAYKTDFSHLLDGQLGDWEKRWFAGGNYGPDASDQRLDLQSRAQLAKWNLVNTNREWRRNRWFFPDYTFEFGALPDYLVSKLLHSPELFRNVSGEEIKQLGAEAVEGKRWALIHESDADAFLKSRRVDGTLKREIIYLKP